LSVPSEKLELSNLTMPEFTPDQFMDVEAFEFYGPNYKELQQQFGGKVQTQAAPSQEPSQELPGSSQEDVDLTPDPVEDNTEEEDITRSDVYRDITSTVGAEEADAVHTYMNDTCSEEELGEYLGFVKSNSPEAVAIFQAAQLAKDSGYEASEDFEPNRFDTDLSAQLVDEFGSEGEAMIQLNEALLAGQITSSQMKQHVMSDPALLRAALSAHSRGLIQF
jgi:hypothetical protein